MSGPNKDLGQHWLRDKLILEAIVDFADVQPEDTILEIGPGQGDLTAVLAQQAHTVIAVEFDEQLAEKLEGQVADNVALINQDILTFDTTTISGPYSIVANIPYYISSKIVRNFLETTHKPQQMTILVQKEVAERIAAPEGEMSVLAVSAQFYADVELGPDISAEYFVPPPKVDSKLVKLRLLDAPRFDVDIDAFLRVVKAGFANRRKKLSNSLAGGLQLDKGQAQLILQHAGIDKPNVRAQELSIDDWHKVYKAFQQAE